MPYIGTALISFTILTNCQFLFRYIYFFPIPVTKLNKEKVPKNAIVLSYLFFPLSEAIVYQRMKSINHISLRERILVDFKEHKLTGDPYFTSTISDEVIRHFLIL